MMRVITLASPRSLPCARVLARSLGRYQPEWSHEVLLLGDDRSLRSSTEAEDPVSVRPVGELLDLDLEALLALHDEQDLAILLLPALLRAYAQRSSDPVLHLPSSVWVLADLRPIERALSTGGVLLVPRTVADVPEDGLQPSRADMERAGRVEQAMMAIDASAEATEFLAWWGGHVEQTLGSPDTRRSGARPEDRPWLARFLELAPARFATAVLEDPGCNLSMWNLHRHSLQALDDGVLVDERWPLRFLNLPGFDPDLPYRLGANASRARVSRSPILHELCERYASELRRSGWSDWDRRADVGRRLHDGLVYDDSLRALYATALALGMQFGDLFSEQGSRAFIAWLRGPAPQGAAHGINRYVFHRVARERPDVVRAYPDLDGPDGAEYVLWCWAYGRRELTIPDGFMPPRPGQPGGPDGDRTSPPRVDLDSAAGRGAASSRASPRLRRNGASRERDRDRTIPSGDRAPAPAAHGERDGDGTTASAEHGPAVRLTGYLSHALGLGAAARGYALALGAAAVPVTTVSVPLHHLALPVALADEYGRHRFEHLVHEGHHGFEIIAVNADELPDLVERLGEDYFQGTRIGIWGWETDSIPARWSDAFALIDEIWVYSRFMADNIGAVAPVPVLALPPPVDQPPAPVAPLRLGVPHGFLFLFVFDYLSTVQRKNPVGLITAFKRAFAPGEGPQLLIKSINSPLRPLAEEEVLWAAHGRPDIHVIDRSLTGEELGGLMAACDCYVSMHRSEGFGLTLAEAMAIGKPVIGTRYSGNVDFMNADNSYLVDFTIGRVGPDCEIYPPEGTWAEPSVEHAAGLMRRVYAQPAEAKARGERARADVSRVLSPVATGRAMRERLEHLVQRGPEARRAVPSR
jgi:glycosyltransferase involved in cell wall biosynthesis